MEIEIFTLCDFAEDFGGKLCVIGTFDSITANKFPAMHPHCSIAARIRFARSEVGKHPFGITIVDEDGKDLIPPLQGELGVQPNPNSDHTTLNIAITIGQLMFQKAGKYSIDLVLDGRQERSLPIVIQQKPGNL